MKYIAKLIREEEGGYSVLVPALEGCVSQGETREEALANIKEALKLWIQGRKDKGWSIPEEDSELVEINY